MTHDEVLRLFGLEPDPSAPPPRTGEEWAKLFGVAYVGEVPAGCGGPLSAYHLSHIYQQRMAQLRAEAAAAQAAPPPIELTEPLRRQIAALASRLSVNGTKVEPQELAERMLEEAILNYRKAS